jgi:hypothetical protein
MVTKLLLPEPGSKREQKGGLGSHNPLQRQGHTLEYLETSPQAPPLKVSTTSQEWHPGDQPLTCGPLGNTPNLDYSTVMETNGKGRLPCFSLGFPSHSNWERVE